VTVWSTTAIKSLTSAARIDHIFDFITRYMEEFKRQLGWEVDRHGLLPLHS